MKEEVLRYALEHWGLDLTRVLDMGCGPGLMTKYLLKYGAAEVDSSDPDGRATARFEQEFGRPCLRCGFEDIAGGTFPARDYTLVVCSYSLHFMDRSLIPDFMDGLTRYTDTLLVIGPRDRPLIASPHWYAAHEYQGKAAAKSRLFMTKRSVPE